MQIVVPNGSSNQDVNKNKKVIEKVQQKFQMWDDVDNRSKNLLLLKIESAPQNLKSLHDVSMLFIW